LQSIYHIVKTITFFSIVFALIFISRKQCFERIAVFEPSTDGTFGVYFPDLPGCVSMGDNFEYAQKMAEEALRLHLWGMEKDHDEIPKPSQHTFCRYTKWDYNSTGNYLP
jgi:Uncharacterized conserved protein